MKITPALVVGLLALGLTGFAARPVEAASKCSLKLEGFTLRAEFKTAVWSKEKQKTVEDYPEFVGEFGEGVPETLRVLPKISSKGICDASSAKFVLELTVLGELRTKGGKRGRWLELEKKLISVSLPLKAESESFEKIPASSHFLAREGEHLKFRRAIYELRLKDVGTGKTLSTQTKKLSIDDPHSH